MSDYMSSILNAFHDMLFVFTAEGVIDDYLTTNHRDELIQPKEVFLGKNYREVLPPHVCEKLDRAFEELDKGEEQFKFDYSVETDAGRQWYVAVLSRLGEHNGSRYLGAVRNITKRKEAEQELRETNEKLKELNRQKDKLFSVISHDLKNASAGITGTLDMILEDYENISRKELLDLLKMLDKRARSTSDLLNDLLLWSKNQFKEVSSEPEKLRLAEVVSSIVELARPHADEKGIKLTSRIPDGLHVYADPNMLKTILRNLLANGIKFSHPSGKIRVEAEKENGMVKISVADEGVGMDKETLNKVMDKQTTFTSRGTGGEKGSGLGLDLCIDFVEKHGGEIRAESEKGKGTTFIFTLPAA